MKNFINLIKKYKLYVLSGLLVILFFRSCQKSVEIKNLGRDGVVTINHIDSLETIITQKQQRIDSIPELIRVEKINIHIEYDSWVSEQNRGQQLMELHPIIKYNIKELQK